MVSASVAQFSDDLTHYQVEDIRAAVPEALTVATEIPKAQRTDRRVQPIFDKGQQIEFILRHYNLRPDEVVFVGDSLMDYEFVRGKGVRFIGLRRLFEEHDFRDRGLFSVKDLTELASVWRRSEGVIHLVNGA